MSINIEETQKIENILQQLSNDDRIFAAAAVRTDGMIIASALPAEINAERAAGVASSILYIGQSFAKEANAGKLRHVRIRGTEGVVYFVCKGLSDSVLIVCVSKAEKIEDLVHNASIKLKNLLNEING